MKPPRTPRRRFMLSAPVRHRPVAADPAARAPTSGDADALGALLLEAYRGTVDDDGETLVEACRLARALFAGLSGVPMWAVSEVTEREGRLVSATIVTLWQDTPLVAQLVTAPDWQRRGLARAGLQRAMNRMAAGDEAVVRLVVTQGNAPAEALYESLGFRPEARPPFSSA
ncbi:MAG: GNAT family N-acetyltransferase [Betaproteobacteria bacterium]|nr:GNAT family N-acetyltransferase [Betaproteobacteria bacterium]